jgi:hypothetical protein
MVTPEVDPLYEQWFTVLGVDNSVEEKSHLSMSVNPTNILWHEGSKPEFWSEEKYPAKLWHGAAFITTQQLVAIMWP